MSNKEICVKAIALIVTYFCLGTEVPRHNAGCISTYGVRTSLFAMRLCKCSNLLYTLNRVSNVFIAYKYILKSDYGFCLAAHESAYQDCSYVNQDNEYSLIHTCVLHFYSRNQTLCTGRKGLGARLH